MSVFTNIINIKIDIIESELDFTFFGRLFS